MLREKCFEYKNTDISDYKFIMNLICIYDLFVFISIYDLRFKNTKDF